MYKVEAYRCDHCNKLKASKSNMKKHESICFRNPESKSCITCVSFTEDFTVTPRNCIRSIDLTTKLKTQCNLHIPIKEEEEF